ncbi:MAG: ATP-binding protein [Bacteroidetes bacterium]|nr:ATP-binding protein [Bacteroidota bacterium]
MKKKLINAHDAIYSPSPIEEYKGNPLIEALPPIENDETVWSKLTNLISISDDDRLKPPEQRVHIVDRIKDMVVPLPEYLQVYRSIEVNIMRAYCKRNPFSPTTMHYLHFLNNDDTPVLPLTGAFQGEGSAMTIEGESGVGKSHMIKAILRTFGQCIQHEEYSGRSLELLQIVWLYVQCPDDESLVSLCKKILFEVDVLTHEDLHDIAVRQRHTKADLKITFQKKTRSNFIGCIVIEDASNLHLPRNGNGNPLMVFLLNFIVESGIPVIFIGNPEMSEVFTQSLKVARRSEKGGYIYMGPMDKKVWDGYAKILWRNQATNVWTPFSNKLGETLKDLSRSVPDLASRTFIEAQKIVIGSPDERITEASLIEGQRRALALTKHTLDWGNLGFNNEEVDAKNVSV